MSVSARTLRGFLGICSLSWSWGIGQAEEAAKPCGSSCGQMLQANAGEEAAKRPAPGEKRRKEKPPEKVRPKAPDRPLEKAKKPALKKSPPSEPSPLLVKGTSTTVDTRVEKGGHQVPSSCEPKPGTLTEPYTKTGYALEVIHSKTGIELVYVPAGEFVMGADRTEEGRDGDEQPQRTVTVARPFYLGKYEITNQQYEPFVKETKIIHPDAGMPTDPNCPAVCVSWLDAAEYCVWAGLRLPSEAEWEYACRAGSTTPFHFGADTAMLPEYAWYDENSGGQTHPVGQKRPNFWGLYDMHGNVWEWCEDVWHHSYDGLPNAQDPLEEGRSLFLRMARGGSWNLGSLVCRSANRLRHDARINSFSVGFRVCLDVP